MDGVVLNVDFIFHNQAYVIMMAEQRDVNLFPCAYLRETEKGNLYTCNIDMTNSFSLPEHEKDAVINCYKLILRTGTP